MRILIAGLGAVGQRHARNLKTLDPAVELHALRSRRLRHVITDSLAQDTGRDVESELGVTVHSTIESALGANPAAVFICTPSALHMEVALAAAASGCHLFIEKPVSNTRDGLDRLAALVADRQLVAAVGCQWRFHPCVVRLHELLQSGVLGPVRAAEIRYTEYLPDWHPYEDYRTSYAARADLGGGVVLTQIHDYDLAWWLFGGVRSVNATGGWLSTLDLDVEDTVDAKLATSAGPVRVSQTFAAKPPQRSITVDGENGRATADLLAGRLEVEPDADRGISLDGYSRNEMFRAEVADFLSCIARGGLPRVPLADGIAVLDVALAVKASLASGRSVSLS
ncbi:MAG: Gfo/Idh/MocA family oxidoreductase [Gemmatimonadetes bacterium]|nr:Gfo/Idh/MocA family oxidoreductase [Gemmatimonadota bacterium]